MSKIKILGLLSHSQKIDDHFLVHGVDYARISNPLRYLDNDKFEVSIRMKAKDRFGLIRDDFRGNFVNLESAIKYYDIVLLSYTVSIPLYLEIAFFCEKHGTKLILELDDNIWEVPVRSGAYKSFHPGSPDLETIEAEVRNSQWIVTTKAKTSYAIAKHCNIPLDRITLNPNYIDLTVYDASKIKRVKDDKIRICYFGTNTHFDDIAGNEGFVKALDRLFKEHDNLQLFTTGFFLPEMKSLWKKHYFSMTGDRDVLSWADKLWVKIMSMSDIAVAPLLESNFTRCKSNIKYLECSAAKLPTVAQKIDQYEKSISNGVDGYLAHNERTWYEYLKELIVNVDKRKEIGQAAYQNIVDNWQIQNNYQKFQDFLISVDKVSKKI